MVGSHPPNPDPSLIINQMENQFMQTQQTQPNDMDLIVRARTGDQAAFAQIYERYAPGIYRYLYCRLGEAELAEDLQSEVFMRLFEGLDRYEDRGWPLSAWLYRIAHDRTIDTVRRRRMRQIVPLEDWSATSEGPEHAVVARMDREEIFEMIEKLTDEQRQVIRLRFMAELSIQEVAQKIGRSEGAVKALQYRGIQSLARMLQTLSA
jgi:RNA polymerase sigma-70 factor (ECF subfamily)